MTLDAEVTEIGQRKSLRQNATSHGQVAIHHVGEVSADVPTVITIDLGAAS